MSATVAAAHGIDPTEVLDMSASLKPVAPDTAPMVARHLYALGRCFNLTTATAASTETMAVRR